jgi:hypothetical protein
MNERDFYDESENDDFFREHLNEKFEFPRKHENWRKVAAILDQKQAKKRFWKWFWLVFFLATGNVWQAYRAFTVPKGSSAQVWTQVVRDTILQHDTVYTYIYMPASKAIKSNNTSIISSKANNSIINFDYSPNYEIINTVKSFSAVKRKDTTNAVRVQNQSYFEKQYPPLNELSVSTQNPLNNNNDSVFTSSDKIINYTKDSLKHLMGDDTPKKGFITPPLERNSLKLLSIPALYAASIENSEKPAIHLRKKLPIRIQPIGIGIQQGFSKFIIMPKNIGGAHWQGLYSDLTFSKNTTIRLSMDYANLNYKISERPTLSEPLRLPAEPTSVGQDFRLKYIEGYISSVQTGIGVQYTFPNRSKWRSFLTGGYFFRTVLPNKTEFEYQHKSLDDEKSVKVFTTGLMYDHWWFAGLGSSVPIYDKWRLQMSAKYIYDNNHNNHSIHYGLIQAGLFYHFF